MYSLSIQFNNTQTYWFPSPIPPMAYIRPSSTQRECFILATFIGAIVTHFFFSIRYCSTVFVGWGVPPSLSFAPPTKREKIFLHIRDGPKSVQNDIMCNSTNTELTKSDYDITPFLTFEHNHCSDFSPIWTLILM